MHAKLIALIVVLGSAAGGCASTATGSAAQPSGSPSPTSTQSSSAKPSTPSTPTTQATPSTPKAPPTTTVTVTKPPPAPAATTATSPTATPAPTAQDPEAVVSAFYAAINAQDYATAWKLGGSNLGSSYSDFAAGFAGTVHDSLTITGVQGSTVDVHLEALESDGSTKVYDGFYIVGNGAITEGRLSQSATTVAPTSPTSPPQGLITDPNGGFYQRGEFCPDADAGLTTQDASGNTLTCVYESGAFHWH